MTRSGNFTNSKGTFCYVCQQYFVLFEGFVNHCKSAHGHFWCDGCNKVWETRNELNLHIARALHTVPATCTVCVEVFDTHLQWLQHGRAEIDHPWCHACMFPLKDEIAVAGHRRNVEHLNYNCSPCNRAFEQASHLAQHVEAKHLVAKSSKVHHCKLCDRHFQQKLHLAQHVEAKHSETPSSSQTRDSPMDEGIEYPIGRHFALPSTNKAFNKHVTTTISPSYQVLFPLMAPSLNVPEVNYSPSPFEQTPSSPRPTMSFEHKRGRTCLKCGRFYKYGWQHDLHQVKRHLMCYACKTHFSSKPELEIHMAMNHLHEVHCPSCQAVFSELSGFIKHVEDRLCPIYDFEKKPSLVASLGDLNGPWRNPEFKEDGLLFRCCACERKFRTAYQYSYHSARPCCPNETGGMTTGMAGVFQLVLDLAYRWDQVIPSV